MPFTGKVGDTLRLNDIGGGHRYVILTKPNINGNVVIVSFTSARYWKEWLVTFTTKDNRRLFSKKTTVNYTAARILPVERLINKATRKPKDYRFCSENHIKRIVIGAFQSQLTPIEILEELKIQYSIESKKYYK
jgi:hypothetical protein